MKLVAFLALSVGLTASCTAQVQLVNGSVDFATLRQYVTSVRPVGGTKAASGILFAVTDSAVVLAPVAGLKAKLKAIMSEHNGTLPPIDSLRVRLQLQTIPYSGIRRLSIHRRGTAVKGLLLGIGLGAIAGVVQGSDEPGWFSFSAGDKAVVFGLIGALVGLVSGVASTKSVNARQQAVAAELQGPFRKKAIVEQLKVANVYQY